MPAAPFPSPPMKAMHSQPWHYPRPGMRGHEFDATAGESKKETFRGLEKPPGVQASPGPQSIVRRRISFGDGREGARRWPSQMRTRENQTHSSPIHGNLGRDPECPPAYGRVHTPSTDKNMTDAGPGQAVLRARKCEKRKDRGESRQARTQQRCSSYSSSAAPPTFFTRTTHDVCFLAVGTSDFASTTSQPHLSRPLTPVPPPPLPSLPAAVPQLPPLLLH